MNDVFHRIAQRISIIVGSPVAFFIALVVVISWALSGSYFGYSDTWQLIINTGTTILTFLVVFLVQNTQNRDARATHLKLDELIRSIKTARNQFLDAEDMSDIDLLGLHNEFLALRQKTELVLQKRAAKKTKEVIHR
jgi:low affinity Fe/Cu permease